MEDTIKVAATVNADVHKVWRYYNSPEHIVKWNFADPSWHCPSASNDMQVGGKYVARMEARDGSFGFDFEAIYEKIDPGKNFVYSMADRSVMVEFIPVNNQTEVTIVFDPESENPVEMQRTGWQMILNNFKTYTENN